MKYPPRENRFGSVSVQDNIWPEQKTERQVKKEKEKKDKENYINLNI